MNTTTTNTNTQYEEATATARRAEEAFGLTLQTVAVPEEE